MSTQVLSSSTRLVTAPGLLALLVGIMFRTTVAQGPPPVHWMRGGLFYPANGISTNHEGTLVAVSDSTVRVYSRLDGKLVTSLPWRGVLAVTFGDTHHGQLLAVKLNAGQVVLHRTSDWSVLHVLLITDGSIPGQPLAFSRGGTYLITSRDAFYVPTFSKIQFSEPTDYLLGINSTTEPTFFDDYVLARFGYFNLRTGQFDRAIPTPDVTHVSFSLDGRFVAPTSSGFKVYSNNGTLLHTNTDGPAEQVQWAPDGNGFLVTSQSGGHVRLYRASDYGLLLDHNAHNDSPSPIVAQFTSNATHVVSASREALSWRSDGSESENLTSHFSADGARPVLAYSHNGALLASCVPNAASPLGWDLGVKLWNPINGDFLEPALDAGRLTTALVFAPDNTQLLVGRSNAVGLTAYQIPNLTPQGVLPTPGPTQGAKGHQNGWIAAWGMDWLNLFGGSPLAPIGGLSLSTNDVAFDRHGFHLVHTAPGGVMIRSLPGLGLVRVSPAVSGQSSEPLCVAWAKDSIFFGFNGLVVKWLLATDEVRTFTLSGVPRSIAASRDGRYVIVGGIDNQLRVVEVASFNQLTYYDQEIGIYGANMGFAGTGISNIVFCPNRSEFAYSRFDGSVVCAGFSFPTAPSLSIGVTLQGWVPSAAGRLALVEIRESGATSALEATVVPVSLDGRLHLETELQGQFDVSVKFSHWLRKTTTTQIGVEGSSFGMSFLNGDVDNDNQVDIADFLAIRSAYGSSLGSPSWNAEADLNGDGSVGAMDFLLLRTNFGRTGDP